MLEGDDQAEGLIVIVDILRAGSVISTLLHNNIEHVVACGELEESYALKQKGYLLFGERDGIAPPGFDYPNSPSLIYDKDFTGKRAAINTQAGTRGIIRAKNTDEILIAGFLNSQAVEKYIKQKDPKKVSLVAAGYIDQAKAEPAIEDEEYLLFLEARLKGQQPDYETILEKVRSHPTIQSRFFDCMNETFPEADFHLSMSLDAYNCVPKVYKEKDLLVIRDANNQGPS